MVFLCTLAAVAQEWRPPPPPMVPPQIATQYPNDANRSRVDDALEGRFVQVSVQRGLAFNPSAMAAANEALSERVPVELVFQSPVTQAQIDAFVDLGGEIDYMYQAVSYGWNGRIELARVPSLPAVLGADLVLVDEAAPMTTTMDVATRTGRARPVWTPGFAGHAPGFTGTSNITIAIVDSGVDDTHTDLAGRGVFWIDVTADAALAPIDINKHGSHVAGIALGTGASHGAGVGTLRFTHHGSLSGSGGFFPAPFNIPGTTGNWSMTATWNGGGTTDLLYVSRLKGQTGPWSSLGGVNGTSPLSVSGSLTGNVNRVYSPGLIGVGDASVAEFVVTNQVTNYPAVGDGFNTFQGVAPGANWAGAKVFTATGQGFTTWTGAGVDAIVAARITHNIKVMNLSLSTTGNPGINASNRQKVNTAVLNGILVTSSAGNNGLAGGGSLSETSDPGRAAMTLTVAAGNDVNQVSDFSSHGVSSPTSDPGIEEDHKPDITAPGGSLRYYSRVMSVGSNSGDGASFPSQQADDYYNIAGTSMSAPFAAGAAALVIEAMESQGVAWDFTSGTHSRFVKMILCATATETNANRESGDFNPTLQRAAPGPGTFPAGKDPFEGYGMINPDAAIEAVRLTYTPGDTGTETLGGGVYDRRAWARTVNLVEDEDFEPTLEVPATGDFDLYLYDAAPAPYGTPVILAHSTNAGDGIDESFTYTPATNQDAILVVKRVSGSGQFTLTTPVDTTPPTVSIVPVSPTLRNTPVDTVTIEFSEPVVNVDLDDFTLTRDGGGDLLTGAQTLTTGDDITFLLGNLAPITQDDGEYTLTLAVSDIEDLAGNPLADGDAISWVMDATPPNAPLVGGPASPTNNTQPTWTWVSGGGGGNGVYRHELNGGGLSAETTDTDFTPGSPLSDGPHTLEVQERDDAGNWSAFGSFVVTIDTVPPNAPEVSGPASPTNDTQPTWTWVSGGGGGNGVYRHELNGGGLSTETTDTDFTPGSPLSDGPHTLEVQERDDAGNWSAFGSFTVTISTQAPDAPVVDGPASPTNDTQPTWTWVSGGGGGNGVYRHQLNGGGLSAETTNTDFTPGSPLSDGPHTLEVQERDDAGNWSAFGSFAVTIDTQAPAALSVTPSTTGPTNQTSVDFAVVFNKPVVNFTGAADVIVGGGGVAHGGVSIAGGPTTYTVTLSGLSGDGTVTLAVNTGSNVQDLSGNALASSATSDAVVIDTIPPGVALQSSAPSLTNSAIPFTAVFTEPVAGLSNGAFAAVNATVSGLSTNDGVSWSFTLTPQSDGAVSVQLPAGAAFDDAGNGNTASNTLAFTYDGTPPAFTAIAAVPDEAADGDTVLIAFEASEPVVGDPVVTVNGNPALRLAKGGPFAYSYTVLPGDPPGPAAIVVTGPDAAGNIGSATNTTALTILGEAPGVPFRAWPLAIALALAAVAALWRPRRV